MPAKWFIDNSEVVIDYSRLSSAKCKVLLRAKAGDHVHQYFFDVHDSVQMHDTVGRELPGVEAARQEAVALAADFASNPHHLTDNGWIIVTVRDGPDNVVLRVRIACSVEVTSDQTVEQLLDPNRP